LLLSLGRGEVEGAEASMGFFCIARVKLVGCIVLGVLGEDVSNVDPGGVGGADSNELGGVGGADCNEEVGGVGIADATGSLTTGSVVDNVVSVFELLGCGVPPGVGATDAMGSTVDNVVSVFELLGCPVFKGVACCVPPGVGFSDNAGGAVSGGPVCNNDPGAVGRAVSNEPGGVGRADPKSGSVFKVVGGCVPPGVGRGETAGSVVDNVVSVFELLDCGDPPGVGATDASGSTVFEILGRKVSGVVGTVGSACAADGIAVLLLLG
jgi:hypothetical protein